MASTFNSFDALILDDEERSELVDQSIVENTPAITTPTVSRLFDTNWADAEDEDPIGEHTSSSSHVPSVSANQSQIKTDQVGTVEEKKAWKAFDERLSKLRELLVTHKAREYNKETKEVIVKQITRSFRIVSKSTYESLRRLIDGFKTHKGTFVNRREQSDKIKMTNTLMEMCYKDTNQPCCFMYPVCILHIGNGRTLTRNEVHKGSQCYFEVSDISYYPAFTPQMS